MYLSPEIFHSRESGFADSPSKKGDCPFGGLHVFERDSPLFQRVLRDRLAMGTGTNLGNLSSGEWDRLQQFADRLETAWQHANATAANVDFRPLLPPATDPLHVEVLHEFVKIDMEARWRRGQGIPLEQYLQQYPTLGPAATLAARLIYEEYRVRRRYGDNPPLAAYANRFPNQFSELERLLQAEPVPDPLTSSAPTLPAPPPDLGDVFREGDILHLDGSYKLVRRIGRGSFGEVWQAEAPGGVEVAAKILKGKIALDEAKRELQALGLIRRLRHVYLLPLHAYWLQQYQLVIVMELCDGSLRARMEECQRRGKPGIPPPELTRYIAEAADALDYLHERNVLHRDIKPENLLYLSRHVQVADFGLARVFEQTRGLVTTSGCGTPAFIAPEVFWQGKVGPHSDQYSLAAAYVELRLGRALFPSHNWSQLMKDHLEKTPDLKPLPDAEQEVLLRALAKDKNDRYPKCSEFAGQLQAAVQLEQ